ncbi:hypothetical protein F5B20DRAFT_478457 [Whalleya microplaca]|nr:hypothetical protein F5B20DRAFT_478457 [Whalleya microplaca]
MAQTPPANVGERLLPSLVDEIAHSDPCRIFYSVAKTNDPSDGFLDITAKTFAQAVDRCSWYIEKNLGRGQGFPTLTYLGPQDVVYGILVLACIKTGYKLLLNSPRNTLEAHLSLFEKMDCNTFLLPLNFPLPVVKQILAARQMRVLEIPGMQDWVEDGPSEPYPYTKTYAEAQHEPFAVMHTSGSTGIPKPVVQTHGTYSTLDQFTLLPSLGYKPTHPTMCAGTRIYLGFPLFHTGGMGMLLPASIYINFTVVLGSYPPSADIVNSIHVHGNVESSCVAPMILVDLVKDPEYLENLGRLKFITFGGGPLPQATGDLISTKTRLVNCVGSTECGVLPNQQCDPEDWAYLSMSPVLGVEYRYVSEDIYEQFIVRNPKLERYQGVFRTFPELNEWPMKDLYSKHPTKENVWLYRGRADDIIVFSTGEKLNPIGMESIINANPVVTAALVTGLGRFQSSLLVEADNSPTNETEKQKLLDVIWPSVQAANRESPSHGRIHRNMIIFTSPDKPMLRAGKGTVQRKSSVDLYATELEALYQANEILVNRPANNVNDNTCGHQSVQDTIKRIVATCTDIDVDGLLPDANLFELGLDSLQVTAITREINNFLSARERLQSFNIRSVYSNPSLAALNAVVSIFAEGKTPAQSTETHEQKLQSIYDMYTANMPISARRPSPKPSNDFVVLLTGSTGSLGSYILDSLISEPRVSKIYCLNRGRRSLERQQDSQAEKGLQELTNKVECWDTDITKPYFGLPMEDYKTLLHEVTTVIHNAWRVDFNLSVDSFSGHISVTWKFTDFSAHSRFNAQLFFISSLGAVSGRSGEVPEQVYDSWCTPEQIGYGESKFVSERLLHTAAREADIPTVICRVGQVAGPTKEAGMWPKQEWLPSLIASSKYLGKLPATLGPSETVDWIPVDMLGKSIVELAMNCSTIRNIGATIYHAVNPQRTEWAKLLPTVRRCLDPKKKIETVPLEAWVDALRKSASKTEDVAQNPAIKLLDFFESMLDKNEEPTLLETKKTLGKSQTLAKLEPISEKLMENWMKQWAF